MALIFSTSLSKELFSIDFNESLKLQKEFADGLAKAILMADPNSDLETVIAHFKDYTASELVIVRVVFGELRLFEQQNLVIYKSAVSDLISRGLEDTEIYKMLNRICELLQKNESVYYECEAGTVK